MINNVLIVDDSFVNIEFLEMFFQKHDVNVETCTKPVDVEKILEEKSFDISLIDYHMPVLDGISMLRLLKRKNLYPKLGRVLILTADTDFTVKANSVADLIEGHLIKPLDIKALENKLFKT